MKRRVILIAAFLTLIYFLIHLSIINDYSINWDFHHVFFAGIYHTGHPLTRDLWQNLPFTDPDPRRMVETPFGPLQSVVPVLSYSAFYEKLKLLTFDSAFNLPAVASGSLGIFILFLFLLETTNIPTAFIGMAFLALYPRYFGDLHTNVKDIPTAVFYAAGIWFAYRAVNRRRWIDIIIAALLCGVTFNFKVNAIFIPIITGVFILYLLFTKAKSRMANPIKNWQTNIIAPLGIYFILAALFSYGIWSVFWVDPYNHLAYLIRFFQYNTINLEVLLSGKWYCSGVNIPWYYPLQYLAIVTPLPVLFAALVGFVIVIVNLVRQKKPAGTLFLLWFSIPLVRFMIPQSSVIDGIRHFEEVVFPLIAIAAIGAESIYRVIFNNLTIQPFDYAQGKQFNHKYKHIFSVGLPLLIFVYLAIQVVSFHPYQLSYFNELAGGLKGAVGQYDLDYWGISQKQAMLWLNGHAPPNSIVNVVMSGDVAGKYLRPDLRSRMNTTGYDQADYVVVLNRQSFFYRYFYLWEYFLLRKTAYVVSSQGVPLTWVFDNHLGVTPRRSEWWHGDDPCMRRYWTSPTPK